MDKATLDAVIRAACAEPVTDESVPLLLAVEKRWGTTGADTIPFLKRLQQVRPGDFWVNLRLGIVLLYRNRTAEAVRYFQTAQALRPTAAIASHNLAWALRHTGQAEEAVVHYRLALRLDPTAEGTHKGLAFALWGLKRHDEAIGQIRTGLRSRPDSGPLHADLGYFLEAAGRSAEAEAAFRRAVALDPKHGDAQRGLRTILIRQGRTGEARDAWQSALASDPPDHAAWYGYAELCLFLGRADEYRRARQALLKKFGVSTDRYVAERVGRACLLLPSSADELRQAAALAERAAAIPRSEAKGAYAFFQFAGGLANYRRGRLDRAIVTMRGDARVLGPVSALVLAMALHRQGQVAEARKTLATAVLAHDWRGNQVRDQDGWIIHSLRREAESIILPNLPAFLDGKYQPQNNDERLVLLGVCQFTNRTRAMASLYADAFAVAPLLAEDVRSGHRFTAARAAALAGCGRGEDAASLDQEEQTRWRKRALAWLKLDVAAWAKKVDSGAAADRVLVRQRLTAWRTDPDLTGVSESGALNKLSALERKEWLVLWKEVDVLFNRTIDRNRSP